MGNSIEVQDQIRQEKYDLIRRMKRKEEPLSHSSFNEFCKSPRHFISYKLRQKETTDAMRFGSMVHCAILEPDRFDELYFVSPPCDRRTKEGKAIWEAAQIEAGEREIVKAEDYDSAMMIGESARRNAAASDLLAQIVRFEQAVEWEYKGWKWRGKIDGDGEENGFLLDLKVLADVSPRKVESYVKYEGAGRQAVHYLRAKNTDLNYYILAVDKVGNISVSKLGKGLLNQVSREIDWYLQKLQQCIFLGEWDSSYDFYTPNGIHEINLL